MKIKSIDVTSVFFMRTFWNCGGSDLVFAAIGEGRAAKGEPAVSIKKSVRPDYIVCLEDGEKHKMLKRHLRTAHDITPDDYRKRWGLPGNYPLVAPKYAEMRSKLAKKIGLGRKPGTKIKKVKARRKA